MAKRCTALGRNLFLYRDNCNVYLPRDGERTIAANFGAGTWLNHSDGLGIAGIDHVMLNRGRYSDFAVHAPAGDHDLLTPDPLDNF